MSDKTEIMNLKAGMSSEALDVFTTEGEEDDTLTKEVATGETPAGESASEDVEEKVEQKPEEKPEEETYEQTQLRAKDQKIASEKKVSRALELENARLQGELKARQELQKPEAPVKSPLQKAKEAYIAENDNLEGFTMTVDLYEEQESFKEEKRIKQASADKAAESQNATGNFVEELQSEEISAEKVGKGLDFKSVVLPGQHYLDQADLMKIQIVTKSKGQKAGLKKAYDLCKEAILAQNEDNHDKILLKAAIVQAGKKSQTKPKKEKTDIDALTTEGEDDPTGEAEKHTINPKLAEFTDNTDGFWDG